MIAHKIWSIQKNFFQPDSKISYNPDRRVTYFRSFCSSPRTAVDKRFTPSDTSTFVVRHHPISFLQVVCTRNGTGESHSSVLANCKTLLSRDQPLLNTRFVGHKRLKKSRKHLLTPLAAFQRLARPISISDPLRGLVISTITC